MTSAVGAYLSFFLDGATGGLIVTLQTLLFLAAFVFAPKHGILAARRRSAPQKADAMSWLFDLVAVPLSYGFMQRALGSPCWLAPSAPCSPAISC